jgi:hypothetical protein
MNRKCDKLVKERMKDRHSARLKDEIKKLQAIENKNPAQENKLCSLSHTLVWIPFSYPNEINA